MLKQVSFALAKLLLAKLNYIELIYVEVGGCPAPLYQEARRFLSIKGNVCRIFTGVVVWLL